MESSNITSISQLPSNSPDINQSSIPIQQQIQQTPQNNIVLNTNEIINETTNQLQNPPVIMSNNVQANNSEIQSNPNYNELISQLQKASANGATGLPSRDIPMNPTQTANDVEIKPNFVPPPPSHEDYIKNMQTPENLINQNNKQMSYDYKLEQFYNELQTPLIVALLYFIFQLPYVRHIIKKYIPVLFAKDGNPNLYGYFFNSTLFAFSFFIILKIINQLNIHVNN